MSKKNSKQNPPAPAVEEKIPPQPATPPPDSKTEAQEAPKNPPPPAAEATQLLTPGPFSREKKLQEYDVPEELREDPHLPKIAALLYFAEAKRLKLEPPFQRFEDLAEDLRCIYLWTAAQFLLVIGKLDLSLVKYREPGTAHADRIRLIDDLEKLINDFNKGVKSPAKVAQFYPARELAIKIVDRPTK